VAGRRKREGERPLWHEPVECTGRRRVRAGGGPCVFLVAERGGLADGFVRFWLTGTRPPFWKSIFRRGSASTVDKFLHEQVRNACGNHGVGVRVADAEDPALVDTLDFTVCRKDFVWR